MKSKGFAFYSNAITTFSEIQTGCKFDYITLASVNSIEVMKLEVMSRRNFLFSNPCIM
jgi:hypothetical protein